MVSSGYLTKIPSQSTIYTRHPTNSCVPKFFSLTQTDVSSWVTSTATPQARAMLILIIQEWSRRRHDHAWHEQTASLSMEKDTTKLWRHTKLLNDVTERSGRQSLSHRIGHTNPYLQERKRQETSQQLHTNQPFRLPRKATGTYHKYKTDGPPRSQ